MKLAYDAIKNNQADLAVLCGGNTLVDTKSEIQFNDLGWLCKDGKPRVFDNDGTTHYFINLQQNLFNSSGFQPLDTLGQNAR